jgi:multidrug efflux pump subunit AcrA (membrane-fusion protein)
MTELIGPAASKKPTKSSQRGFGFKTALWIGGLLTIVTCIVLWAEVSKGSKVDHQSVAAEGVAPRTVPIAKAGRETLTKDVLLYGEFKPYQEILVHAKVSGYVRSIGVDIGDHVQAAQPLAKLEIPELNDDLNRASAVLAKVRKRSNAQKLIIAMLT